MTRDILDSDTENAVDEPLIAPVDLVKLEFDDGTVLLHTGLGSLVWDGDTYTGAGGIGFIGTTDEDSELSRTPLEIGLRGLPTDLVAVALSQQYQGRPATVYRGYLNPETMQLVGDPFIRYRGRMDTMEIEQGEKLNITMSVENRFAAWDKPRVRRYNSADQQSRFPGDRGLEYAEQSTDKTIVWGAKG
jgi:hypothetical protein